jgi:MFS transporter, PPP family, 3-phenylpropionic acid transporter
MLKLWDRIRSSCHTLGAFLVLYAALYAVWGPIALSAESSPSRDLRPEAIALVLACGGVVGLVAGPAAGRLADRLGAPKRVLSFAQPRRR